MENNANRVKLIIIGLVLTAVVVGYFILAQKFSGTQVSSSPVPVTSTTPNANIKPNAKVTPAPTVIRYTPVPSARGSKVINFNVSQTPVPSPAKDLGALPNTGVPDGLMAVFAISAMVSGWFLRKFPK